MSEESARLRFLMGEIAGRAYRQGKLNQRWEHDPATDAVYELFASLEQRLAAAEQDTKRLDWLEEHSTHAEPVVSNHARAFAVWSGGDNPYMGRNVREAIDYAALHSTSNTADSGNTQTESGVK